MQELKIFFQNKRNLIGLIVFLVLVLAIPLGIYLVKTTQIFAPKADVIGSITLAEGNCVTTLNGKKVITCKDVPLRLISPFGKSSPSPSPSISTSSAPPPGLCNPQTKDRDMIIATWIPLKTCTADTRKIKYSCTYTNSDGKIKTKKKSISYKDIGCVLPSSSLPPADAPLIDEGED